MDACLSGIDNVPLWDFSLHCSCVEYRSIAPVAVCVKHCCWAVNDRMRLFGYVVADCHGQILILEKSKK